MFRLIIVDTDPPHNPLEGQHPAREVASFDLSHDVAYQDLLRAVLDALTIRKVGRPRRKEPS